MPGTKPPLRTADLQYISLQITPPTDDLIDTNQFTSVNFPDFTQQPSAEGHTSTTDISRDNLPTAEWNVSHPGDSWSSSDLLAGENFFSDEWYNFRTGTPITYTGGFQCWLNHEICPVEDWSTLLNPQYVSGMTSDAFRPFESTVSSGADILARDFHTQAPNMALREPRGPVVSLSAHGFDLMGQMIYCQQCNSHFSNRALLKTHARETKHTPHRCRCGKSFSRLDVLRRHIHTNQHEVSYPCPHCKKHRGLKAFARLDHLTQHLRGYHHMESESESDGSSPQQSSRKQRAMLRCPHDTCSYTSGTSLDQQHPGVSMKRTFQTRGEFTKHLREVHNESMFPCAEIGCSRVGAKGFFREKDLLKHVKDHHSAATLEASAT